MQQPHKLHRQDYTPECVHLGGTQLSSSTRGRTRAHNSAREATSQFIRRWHQPTAAPCGITYRARDQEGRQNVGAATCCRNL